MKKRLPGTMALMALILATASQAVAEPAVAGFRASGGDKYPGPGLPALLRPGRNSDAVAPTSRESDERAENPELGRPASA